MSRFQRFTRARKDQIAPDPQVFSGIRSLDVEELDVEELGVVVRLRQGKRRFEIKHLIWRPVP